MEDRDEAEKYISINNFPTAGQNRNLPLKRKDSLKASETLELNEMQSSSGFDFAKGSSGTTSILAQNLPDPAVVGPPKSILPPNFSEEKELPSAPLKRKKTLSERLFSRRSGKLRDNKETLPKSVSNSSSQKCNRESDVNWENDSDIEFGKPQRSRFVRWKEFFDKYPYWMQCFLMAFIGVCIFMFFGMIDWIVTVNKQPDMRDVYFANFESTSMSIQYVSIYSFSVWLSLTWAVWCFLRWFIHYLPELMVHILSYMFDTISSQMELYIDYVTYLEVYIRGVLGWMTAYIAWCSIFTNNPSWPGNVNGVDNNTYSFANTVQYILLTVMMIYIIIAIEKLFLQMFAINFHRMAYSDRIRRSKNSVFVLERLNEVRFSGFSKTVSNKQSFSESQFSQPPKQTLAEHSRASTLAPQPGPPVLDTIVSDSDTDSDSTSTKSKSRLTLCEEPLGGNGDGLETGSPDTPIVSSPNEVLYGSKGLLESPTGDSRKQKSTQNFHARMAELGNIMSQFGNRAAKVFDRTTAAIVKSAEQQRSLVMRSSADAKRLAKKIFAALDKEKQGYLSIGCFEAIFEDKKEAKVAFTLFDLNNNGSISLEEFYLTFETIYKERVALGRSLRDSSQALSKLDSILKTIAFIVLFFITLSIFQVNYKSLLTTLLSLWVGLVFAVGPTVKSLLEAVIFLFVTHPFDVGDRVDIEGESYVVKEFGIMTTALRRIDGVEVYAPNAVLSTKLIQNIRRSGNAIEKIVVPVSVATPITKIREFQNIICGWLRANQRDYVPQADVGIDSIVDKERMDILFVVTYKSNNQDGSKQGARRRALLSFVRDAIKQAGLDVLYDHRLKIHTDSDEARIKSSLNFDNEEIDIGQPFGYDPSSTRRRNLR